MKIYRKPDWIRSLHRISARGPGPMVSALPSQDSYQRVLFGQVSGPLFPFDAHSLGEPAFGRPGSGHQDLAARSSFVRHLGEAHWRVLVPMVIAITALALVFL